VTISGGASKNARYLPFGPLGVSPVFLSKILKEDLFFDGNTKSTASLGSQQIDLNQKKTSARNWVIRKIIAKKFLKTPVVASKLCRSEEFIRKKHYGIRIPWKYRIEGITHLSRLHELRIVKMARLGFAGTGSAPVLSAGPRRWNQFF
jgi:hypothetical protein